MSGNIIKLFHHRELLEQKKTPISCQFILTNRCNLKCEFCCNKHRDQSLIMDTKTALKALEDSPNQTKETSIPFPEVPPMNAQRSSIFFKRQ